MAWQSSRIIWDKNKTDSSEPQPVTIYDPTGTIYVAGNYALHSDHSGSVAEDYQLYLCKVEETGSDFVSSDWELQKGVKNWYLIARRQFKKGARVIKSDTNGDTASLRLYKCISSMKQPNVWNPDEWEVVYQDVGVAYEVRDHKDVYYDSGSNRNKWHKMMYYLLPENPDKSDEEIEIFSEDRVYHKDDYVIKIKNNNEVALFKYISNTPRAGWDSTRWSEDVSVAEYEANIPYNKGDWIIRKYIEIYEFVIMEFQAGLRYYNGKYCLHIINPDDINPDIPVFNENVIYSRGDKVSYNRGLWEYNLNIPLSGPWIPAYWDNIGKTFPDWYRERILGGESLYGLYRANTTVCGSWNDSEWDLIIDGVIQIRGRDYNTRGLCIMQFQIGQDYLAGDVVIWTATNDTSEFGLSVAKVDIYNCSPAQAPPNETNWNNITETLENPDQYHVYKAKSNMTAGYNSHFRRDDWLIVTQKILPDDGLYGVIWEKYGKPTPGGGMPFFAPLLMWSSADFRTYDGWLWNMTTKTTSLDNFYPFPGNNVLEIGQSITGHFRHLNDQGEETDYHDDGYPIDTLITDGLKIYGVYNIGYDGDGSPHGIVCSVFGKWHTFGQDIQYERFNFTPCDLGVIILNVLYLISADGSSVVGQRTIYENEAPNIQFWLQNADIYEKGFTYSGNLNASGSSGINGVARAARVEKTIVSGNPGNTTAGTSPTHMGWNTNLYWVDPQSELAYGAILRNGFIFDANSDNVIDLPACSYQNYYGSGTYKNTMPKEEFDDVDLSHLLLSGTNESVVWYQITDSFSSLPSRLQIMYNLQSAIYGYTGRMGKYRDSRGREYDAFYVYRPYAYIPQFESLSGQSSNLLFSNIRGTKIFLISTMHYTTYNQALDTYTRTNWIKLTTISRSGYDVKEIDCFDTETEIFTTIYIYSDDQEIWFIKNNNLYKISTAGDLISKASSASFYIRHIKYRGNVEAKVNLWDSSYGHYFDLIGGNDVEVHFIYGNEPEINAETEYINEYPYTRTIKKLYIPLLAFYRQPWCGLTGAPAGKANGLYISGWFTYNDTGDTGGSTFVGSIAVCLPGFPRSLATAEALGFYWINAGSNRSGENIYGGTGHNGFEGW